MTQGAHTFEQCPACDAAAAASEVLFMAALFGQPCRIRRCRACGLVFKEWFRDAQSLVAMYPAGYVHFDTSAQPGAAELNSAKQKLARCRRLLGDARPPDEIRLLDVGCGAGGFVRIARALGYDADGIDPYLPDNLRSQGLIRGTPADREAATYDIAVLLNVAEHVPVPQPLFAAVRRLLKPGGVLLITCPYGDSLARRFHRARWTHLSLDEHVLFWTPRSLRLALRRAGFKGPESLRIAGSPFPFGRTQTAAPDRSTVPRPLAAELPSNRATFQSQVWRIAKRLQAHEAVANMIRHLVHMTRSGDYIEYAIRAER